jgi:hypothetical protein
MLAVLVTATATSSPLASAEVVRAVEYYHQAFEHYFVTANPAEIAALDSGAFTGWWRTGQRYQVDTAPAEGLVPVCRFYTSAYAGKASHFYTASESECARVKTLPDWIYEGVAFYSRMADTEGNCGEGSAAIHRMFNNGRGGAPNHAYVADTAKRKALAAAGWLPEQVAFCAPLAAGDALAKMLSLDKSVWDLPLPTIIFAPASPMASGRIQTQFEPVNMDSVTSGFQEFSYYGFAMPPVPIFHVGQVGPFFPFGGFGGAGWDPFTGDYFMFIDVFGPRMWQGVAWTFDNAQDRSRPACTMGIWNNSVSLQPEVPHPFQPYLLSGCERRVANRLP